MTKITAKPIYLFANWKMYLDVKQSLELAKKIKLLQKKAPKNITLAVFSSALALAEVFKTLKKNKIAVGAQNVFWVPAGGYTGEVSAQMFALAGAKYALVGHSERRHQFKETNHEVMQKMEATLLAGLTPVLCVGETRNERDRGETDEVVEAQLRAAYYKINWPAGRQVVVAYEPVWAISKGIGVGAAGGHCEPAEAERIHLLINKILKGIFSQPVEPVILFGGSVRPNTVKSYLLQPHVNGVLVGAASTQFNSLKEILTNSLVK